MQCLPVVVFVAFGASHLLGADEENRDLGLLHASATGNALAGGFEGMMAPTARPRRKQRAPSWMQNFRSVEEAGKQAEHGEQSRSAPQVRVVGVVEPVRELRLTEAGFGLAWRWRVFCPLIDARTGSKALLCLTRDCQRFRGNVSSRRQPSDVFLGQLYGVPDFPQPFGR